MSATTASCSRALSVDAPMMGERVISASFPPFAPLWPAASSSTSASTWPSARRLARGPSMEASCEQVQVSVTTATIAASVPSARAAAVATLLAALSARLLACPPARRDELEDPFAAASEPTTPLYRTRNEPPSPPSSTREPRDPTPPSFSFTPRPMTMSPAPASCPTRPSAMNLGLGCSALASASGLNPEAEVWERRLREGWVDRNGDARGAGGWPRGTSGVEEGVDEDASESEDETEGDEAGQVVEEGSERPAR